MKKNRPETSPAAPDGVERDAGTCLVKVVPDKDLQRMPPPNHGGKGQGRGALEK